MCCTVSPHLQIDIMAPRKDMVPVSVKKALEFLKEKGLECTADNMAILPFDIRDAATSALRSKLKNMPEKIADGYKNLKSDADRRGELCKFLITPSMAYLTVSNTTVAGTTRVNADEGEWCTEEELTAPHRCNGAESAKLYMEDAESQLHERPAYAAKGIKQYMFVRKTELKSSYNKSEAAATAVAEVEPEDYEKIKEALEDGVAMSGAQPKKKAKDYEGCSQ